MSGHVVVVGAGIIGLSSAWYLREAGFEVTVVERDQEERFTSSFGNAGMIVPSHVVPLSAPGVVWQGIRWMSDPMSPFYIKPRLSPGLLAWGWRFWRSGTEEHVRRSAPLLLELNERSRELYREVIPRLGEEVAFSERGILMLCNTAEGLNQEAQTAEFAAQFGMKTRVLGADEVRQLEPDIELAVEGAVHYPGDAFFDPSRLMRALQERLVQMGVRFRFGSEVTGLRRARGQVDGVLVRPVDTAGEPPAPAQPLEAGQVVLAAGSWSAQLGRDAGVRLMLQPGKGYSFTIERPSQRLRTAALLSEARIAVTPMGQRLRIGGTMELAGFDASHNERRLEGIRRGALRYFPGLDRDELLTPETWYGYRPCSPDGLPYLGRSQVAPQVIVATGHAMMGMSLGPVTGQLVAGLAAGEELPVDIGALSPARHGQAGRL